MLILSLVLGYILLIYASAALMRWMSGTLLPGEEKAITVIAVFWPIFMTIYALVHLGDLIVWLVNRPLRFLDGRVEQEDRS